MTRLPSLRVRASVTSTSITPGEIFFDLIFVFAVTRVADLIVTVPGPQGYLQAGLIVVLTWTMYDATAWTAASAPANWTGRSLTLLSVMGFLIMGVTAPTAFGSGRWTFAVAYAVIVVLHLATVAAIDRPETSRTNLFGLPYQLGSAGLVVVAAANPESWRVGLWCLAVLVVVLGAITDRGQGPHALHADHLAERHHLVIMVVLAALALAMARESQDVINNPVVLVTLVCGVGLIATLWWLYFGGDGTIGIQADAETRPLPGTRAVVITHTLSHLLQISGLILVMAGVRSMVAAPLESLPVRSAVILAAGTAIFCLGEAFYEWRLRIGNGMGLIVTAVVVLPTAVPGSVVSGLSELALLLGVLLVHIGLRRVARNPGGVAT